MRNPVVESAWWVSREARPNSHVRQKGRVRVVAKMVMDKHVHRAEMSARRRAAGRSARSRAVSSTCSGRRFRGAQLRHRRQDLLRLCCAERGTDSRARAPGRFPGHARVGGQGRHRPDDGRALAVPAHPAVSWWGQTGSDRGQTRVRPGSGQRLTPRPVRLFVAVSGPHAQPLEIAVLPRSRTR